MVAPAQCRAGASRQTAVTVAGRVTAARHLPAVNVPAPLLSLPVEFLTAVTSKSKVAACPHNLYKYPARFSPEFAREAIRTFSQPGDLILDVFQGSGTTLTEAIALGRYAVGYDISQLACFLARTKTTTLSVHDERALVQWGQALDGAIEANPNAVWEAADTDEGYYRKNLPGDALRFFAGVIGQLPKLKKRRQRQFARLVLLAVGQWALDCKTRVPSREAMQEEYGRRLVMSVREFRAYTWNVAKELGLRHGSLHTRRKVVRASAERCGANGRPPHRKAALIVTSPPYPGVHMLYHRWQILGRRETPAPFVLADCRDGDGISFYSLGNRHEKGLVTYYERLTKVFTAARRSLKKDGLVIQLVAFNQPSWQLPAFLRAMEAAGYTQVMPALPQDAGADGNLWRGVPGRRWYVEATKKGNATAREVVLFHRPNPET
jgi:hypothetical protein